MTGTITEHMWSMRSSSEWYCARVALPRAPGRPRSSSPPSEEASEAPREPAADRSRSPGCAKSLRRQSPIMNLTTRTRITCGISWMMRVVWMMSVRRWW